MSRENKVIGKDLKYWPLMVSLQNTKAQGFKEWLQEIDLQLVKRYMHVFFATDLRAINIDTVDLFEASKIIKYKSYYEEPEYKTKEERVMQEDRDVELVGALVAFEYFRRKKPQDPNVLELAYYDVKEWRLFQKQPATKMLLCHMLEAKSNPIFSLYAAINYEACLL